MFIEALIEMFKEKFKTKTFVIKVGTGTLTCSDLDEYYLTFPRWLSFNDWIPSSVDRQSLVSKSLVRSNMAEIVEQLAALHQRGHRLILVSSGAEVAGREYLNHCELPDTLASKQLLATVGQSQLIQAWESLFSSYQIKIRPLQLTRADIDTQARFLNTRNEINALLDQQIIPIINENEAIATAESRIGDNDKLSAFVATLAEADRLILITHQPPLSFDGIKGFGVVRKLTREIRTWIPSELKSKVIATDIAIHAGVETNLLSDGCLPLLAYAEYESLDFVEKDHANVGDPFLAQKNSPKMRKPWRFAALPAGALILGAEAAKAFCRYQESILPAGIRHITGQFEQGEMVEILDEENELLALGISRYNSDCLAQIKGKQSDEIKAILGDKFSEFAIHSDEMVVHL